MESINSLKTAATRAIWGDEHDQDHQEPVSGRTGDVSKGEPYDAGNMEPDEVSKSTAPDETGTRLVETDITEGKQDDDNDNRPEKQGQKENPAAVSGSSTTKSDSTEAQNDVRDPADPAARHESKNQKENVDDSGAGAGTLDVGENPDKKFDGPGPRPIEQVARENGGDAGKSSSGVHVDEDGDEDKKGTGEGTGELYVRSSGLKADGGDFDAAAPGAGREADRLLEEKGMHKESPNGGLVGTDGSPTSPSSSSPAGGKEKTSLKTKIKAKLHRGSATAA